MFSHVSVHPSIHLSVHRGDTPPGQAEGTPDGGYPCQEGYPTSGTPIRPGWLGGVPHLGYPHQAWSGGTPAGGGTPPWVPPVRPGGGTPAGGVPHLR